MGGYRDNSECVLDYLSLFQALAAQEADGAACRARWEEITQREGETEPGVQLAPRQLRQCLGLSPRDFLLTMAALALEMDGNLRGGFRRLYALNLPTVEYGLQLISPLCPSGCDTLAELAGPNPLTGLVLTTAELTAYPLERPLILCRTALTYLTGLSQAEIPCCTALLEEDVQWLPLHEEALEQVEEWYAQGAGTPLYLCAPIGSGRRTLLRRACGHVVCVELGGLSKMAALDRDHILRENALLALILACPVCFLSGGEASVLEECLEFCRRRQISAAVLAEEDRALEGAQEVVRLPRQLTPLQREDVWRAFVPQSRPDAAPDGAMTVGAVRETALLALRHAAGRETVTRADTRAAMLRRSGALEFGVRYDLDASLDDMVLPASVREQIELICQSARSGARLAEWGIPRQREGVTAVFHGPSGTGKSMAAAAIAHTLGMPLLRADLSQLMDKYVGETEKHLGRLLRSARENHCVLLFDEADSLFGKRASVSTGHDKYANLSTSYLLQEIESYDGVALLSTNLLSNFDDAFLRRLHYIVRFPLPEAPLREELWRRAVPAERRAEELPFPLLAQAELSPARILAAARSAAVAAMATGQEKITAAGATKALRLELEKGGKPLPRGLDFSMN